MIVWVISSPFLQERLPPQYLTNKMTLLTGLRSRDLSRPIRAQCYLSTVLVAGEVGVLQVAGLLLPPLLPPRITT